MVITSPGAAPTMSAVTVPGAGSGVDASGDFDMSRRRNVRPLRANSESCADQVNRSHADWREMPSAAPICAQLTSRDRRRSTVHWS